MYSQTDVMVRAKHMESRADDAIKNLERELENLERELEMIRNSRRNLGQRDREELVFAEKVSQPNPHRRFYPLPAPAYRPSLSRPTGSSHNSGTIFEANPLAAFHTVPRSEDTMSFQMDSTLPPVSVFPLTSMRLAERRERIRGKPYGKNKEGTRAKWYHCRPPSTWASQDSYQTHARDQGEAGASPLLTVAWKEFLDTSRSIRRGTSQPISQPSRSIQGSTSIMTTEGLHGL